MIVTLNGENSFGLHAELDRLVAGFLAEYGDMALERLDGEEVAFEKLQEALQSLPFLVSRKMVVLRAPGTNKQFAEHAERLLSELPETADVILVEPKLDKRLGYYKFLKKHTDFREFTTLDRIGLAKWLAQRATEQGGQLSQADAIYLVDRIGLGQQLLAGELAKLLLYEPNITHETIEQLTEATPQSTIFELIEAAFAGNTKRALALYMEQRTMKVEPQQIIAMLAWQLHVLSLIKTAGDRTPDQIAQGAKLNPYVVRKSASVAHNLTLPELKTLTAKLLQIDVRLKRTPINPDEAMQNFLLSITMRTGV
jgi:DNA polymerase-3 subunit delta